MAMAGEDQSFFEFENVMLAGAGKDVDGKIVSYQWTQVSGKKVEGFKSEGAKLSFAAPGTAVDMELAFKLTVTDDGGAKGRDTVKVTIKPAASSNFDMTLVGKVITEKPLANARVVISAGDFSVDTVTNESGGYSVKLVADKSYADRLVNITITGTGDDASIKLISSGVNLNNLKRKAGVDMVVDASDYSAVNVSYLSTAVAAIAQSDNNNVFPDTEETLTQFASNLHPVDSRQRLMDVATSIKMLAENPEVKARYLPSATDNIFSFATDSKRLEAFIKAVESAGANGASGHSGVSAHSDLSGQFNTAFIGLKKTLETNAVKLELPTMYAGFIHSMIKEGALFSFAPDNQGTLLIKDKSQSFSWTNDSQLSLNFNGANVYSQKVKLGATGGGTVNRDIIFHSMDMKVVAQYGQFDMVQYRLNWTYQYPDGNHATPATQTAEGFSLMARGYQPLTSQAIIGTRAIPVNATINKTELDNVNNLKSAIFNFSEGGVVSYQKPEFKQPIIPGLDVTSGTWSLSGNGFVTMQMGNYSFELKQLAKGYLAVSSKYSFDQSATLSLGLSEAKDNRAQWTKEQLAGTYQYSNGIDKSLISTNLQLNLDGTGSFTRKIPALTQTDALSGMLTESISHWEVSDGKLIIESKRAVSVPEPTLPAIMISDVAVSGITLSGVLTSRHPGFSSSLPENLNVKIKREFSLLSQEDNRYYVVEHEKYMDPHVAASGYQYDSVQMSSAVLIKTK